jgi:hypothetical protein
MGKYGKESIASTYYFIIYITLHNEKKKEAYKNQIIMPTLKI